MIITRLALTALFIIAVILARRGEALGVALALVGLSIALEVLP